MFYVQHVIITAFIVDSVFGLGGTFDDPIDSDVYTLCCGAVFMEFIPVENMDEENPKTLFVDQVADGYCICHKI